MTRVALLSSEPIRPRMAGIGIRYLELARRFPARFAVVDGRGSIAEVGKRVAAAYARGA